jgi:hypothetical protein
LGKANAVPLISALSRGDSKLQACLVNDAAHVTPGARRDHVAKVQIALFVLDGSKIDRQELGAKQDGPSTAAVVLFSTHKRQIINYSYDTRAANIVGKMRRASL